ncbi:DUF6082 family protein [Streptomyces sp. TLI_146]|uniref:DUF6082 family protein n=1 Tax=Streptomyces sp. TLI_146 TaxID=1938858 RepID=UPI00117FB8E1|nr:DUF6082 family protein [Streptomyces sp. TLI_146]
MTPQQRRQYLFANALYTNLLISYRIGNRTKEESSSTSAAASGSSGAPRSSSGRALQTPTDEAELGKLVDDLLQQLEDADTDEWWVVGEPPGAGSTCGKYTSCHNEQVKHPVVPGAAEVDSAAEVSLKALLHQWR